MGRSEGRWKEHRAGLHNCFLSAFTPSPLLHPDSSSCTQQLPGESCLQTESLKPNKALPPAKSPLPVAPSLRVAGGGLLPRQFLERAGWVLGSAALQSCKTPLLEPWAVGRCCWKGRCGTQQALASRCVLLHRNHPPSLCPAPGMLLETCSLHTVLHRGAETPPNVPSLPQVSSGGSSVHRGDVISCLGWALCP